jgi:hypothetical protein
MGSSTGIQTKDSTLPNNWFKDMAYKTFNEDKIEKIYNSKDYDFQEKSKGLVEGFKEFLVNPTLMFR